MNGSKVMAFLSGGSQIGALAQIVDAPYFVHSTKKEVEKSVCISIIGGVSKGLPPTGLPHLLSVFYN